MIQCYYVNREHNSQSIEPWKTPWVTVALEKLQFAGKKDGEKHYFADTIETI